jgi:hypothetical protein
VRLLLLLLGLGTSSLVVSNVDLGLLLQLLGFGTSVLALLLELGQAGGTKLGKTGRGGGALLSAGALAAARSDGRVHLDGEGALAACSIVLGG